MRCDEMGKIHDNDNDVDVDDDNNDHGAICGCNKRKIVFVFAWFSFLFCSPLKPVAAVLWEKGATQMTSLPCNNFDCNSVANTESERKKQRKPIQSPCDCKCGWIVMEQQ